MQSLTQLLEEHKSNKDLKALQKMEEESWYIIDFVHDKVEKLLDKGMTPVQERKNLVQAQSNHALIVTTIKQVLALTN